MTNFDLHHYIIQSKYDADVKRRLNAIIAMLESGADIEVRDKKTGRTPLQAACWKKDDGLIIKTLLKHGASVQPATTTATPPCTGPLSTVRGFARGVLMSTGGRRASSSRPPPPRKQTVWNPVALWRRSRLWSRPGPTPTR